MPAILQVPVCYMFLCAHLSLDKWLRGSLFSLSTLPPLQAKNERNYHIFYELLAGLPAQLRQAFSLQEAETYYYLNQVSLHKESPSSVAPKPQSPTAPGSWGRNIRPP